MSTGFGRDTWCIDSQSITRFATGRTLVAQAIYRRLTTPRGTLRGGTEQLSYGYDVTGLIGDIGTDAAAVVLRHVLRAEVLKDDRVQDVAVTVTRETIEPGQVRLLIDLRLQLVGDNEAFTLTLSAENARLAIVGGLPQ